MYKYWYDNRSAFSLTSCAPELHELREWFEMNYKRQVRTDSSGS